MRVSEVLKHLKYGELANTQMTDTLLDDSADRSQVFSYINRAIVELNTEFSLNQAEYIVDLKENTARYFVSPAKILKILTAYKSDGTELILNDEGDPLFSLYTPSFNVIEYYGENLSTESIADYLSIIYLREYDKVESDVDTIPLPLTYLTCLTSYIGYLSQQSLGIVDNTVALNLKANYLESLNRLKVLGLVPDMVHTKNLLTERGFV